MILPTKTGLYTISWHSYLDCKLCNCADEFQGDETLLTFYKTPTFSFLAMSAKLMIYVMKSYLDWSYVPLLMSTREDILTWALEIFMSWPINHMGG